MSLTYRPSRRDLEVAKSLADGERLGIVKYLQESDAGLTLGQLKRRTRLKKEELCYNIGVLQSNKIVDTYKRLDNRRLVTVYSLKKEGLECAKATLMAVEAHLYSRRD